MKTIALCWIGIGNYNIFFDRMYLSFNLNFCNELDKTFFIFTDLPKLYENIVNAKIYDISNACRHKGFILFRKWKYCLMAEDLFLNYDYIAFVNGNMVCMKTICCKDVISEKFPVTIITHPSNLYTKANTYNCNTKSYASFMPTEDWQYKQAGFNVSTSVEFLKMANTIEAWRHLDKAQGTDKYVPWHDETYANKYFYMNKNKLNILDGNDYACPSNFPNANNCKIMTINKEDIALKLNGYIHIASTPSDLYNLSN